MRAFWQGRLLAILLLLTGCTGPASVAAKAPGTVNIDSCGNATSRVLLSFDDWPYNHPTMLGRMSRLARRLDVGLLLFPLGEYNTKYTVDHGINLAQVARNNGMYVGNHSFDHPHMTSLTRKEQRLQISHGVPSTLFRPPYGEWNDSVQWIAANQGYRLCTWTLDTGDWTGKTGPQVRHFIMANLRPGDVVLMHMEHAAFNPVWFRRTIRRLRNNGFQLCRPWHNAEDQVAPSPTALPVELPC